MVENSHVRPMKFLLRGSYCLALTLPLLGGAASSEIQSNKINADKFFLEDEIEIADSKNKEKSKGKRSDEQLVFISEVIVRGLENHPDEGRLRTEAYDAMSVKPGARISREELKRDLNALYATGWFSGLEIDPVDTSLGVRVEVNVQPNPVFHLLIS